MEACYAHGANSYVVNPVDNSFTKTVSDVGLYWLSLNQVPHKTTSWDKDENGIESINILRLP